MNEVLLKENERIDDLQLKGLKIIQNTEGFRFGIDAVLLANYCQIKPNSTIVDLGTGTGIIPLILYGKNKVDKIYGVEIQEEVAEMAKRSIMLNGLEDNIEILNINLKNVEEAIEINSIDVVVSNPPYMDVGTGKINPNDKKAISRHELMCELEDVIEKAKRLLKHNGRFFMIHRPNRLTDILYYLRKHKLEPKTLRFIHPKATKAPNLVLIKSIKAAKPELRIEQPLYVYNDDGQYTEEIHRIYGLDK